MGLAASNSGHEYCRCSCCGTKKVTEVTIKGSLPCGATVETKIPSEGFLKVRVTAGHTFHRDIYNGVELTITRDGIVPLINYLERLQRAL